MVGSALICPRSYQASKHYYFVVSIKVMVGFSLYLNLDVTTRVGFHSKMTCSTRSNNWETILSPILSKSGSGTEKYLPVSLSHCYKT